MRKTTASIDFVMPTVVCNASNWSNKCSVFIEFTIHNQIERNNLINLPIFSVKWVTTFTCKNDENVLRLKVAEIVDSGSKNYVEARRSRFYCNEPYQQRLILRNKFKVN